jgi:hypothetical protein
MPARLVGASVTHDCALVTCEPGCVPEVARSFFITVLHSQLRVVAYVAALKLSSQRGEGGATWQHRSPHRQGGEVRS